MRTFNYQYHPQQIKQALNITPFCLKRNILSTSTFSDIMIWKPYKLNLHIGHKKKKSNSFAPTHLV